MDGLGVVAVLFTQHCRQRFRVASASIRPAANGEEAGHYAYTEASIGAMPMLHSPCGSAAEVEAGFTGDSTGNL